MKYGDFEIEPLTLMIIILFIAGTVTKIISEVLGQCS